MARANFRIVNSICNGYDAEVLVSCETPVAVKTIDGFKVTRKWHSSTTNRHIAKFVNAPHGEREYVDQSVIDNVYRKVVPDYGSEGS